MEQKKTTRADMERRRTTGFLMALALVLALLYVALEWNSSVDNTPVDALDLDELVHESELVPMSNVETIARLEEKQQVEKAEQLRVVDDDVELQQPEEQLEGETDANDDETLLQEIEENLDDEKALASMGVDPNNPLNFHIAEDLPQFPGGAVEFMKWLTKHLRYPNKARQQKVQGKVVAVFYVEKDGTITGISVTKSLSPECDREALRVLRMMPNWKPGIQQDQPCRTKVCIPIVFRL
ncbi:MAG: energy transducer TonB [Prevotella sp.]|nr:energy transducer TonB [Prevotella sp.]